MIQWNSKILDLINTEFNGDSSLFAESPFFRNYKVRKYGIDFKYEKFEIAILNNIKNGEDTILNFLSFKPKPFQTGILNKIHTYKNVIIGTCRQVGATTMLSIHALNSFVRYKNVLVITPNGGMCEYFIDKVKTYYKELPFYLQPGINAWNARSIGNDNNSIVAKDGSSLSKDDSFSFKEFDVIIFDCASKIKNLKSIYHRAFLQNSKVQIILHSNDNDSDNLLSEIMANARTYQNNFQYEIIRGTDAGFSEEELILHKKSLGQEAFDREFNYDWSKQYDWSKHKGIDAVDLVSKTLSGELKEMDDRNKKLDLLETKLRDCIKFIEYIANEIDNLKK